MTKIWTPPHLILPGRRRRVPADVARAVGYDQDRSLRELMRQLDPHHGQRGTLFAGSEVLANISAPGAAWNTSVAEGSLVPRDSVGSFAPSYWSNPRSCLRLTAYGTLSVVAATTPTILLKVKQNTAYANPIAGAILAGSVFNVATATLSGVANAWWILDLLMGVRATGPAGTILATGRLNSNIFVAAADERPFMNANPPTAVAEDLTLNQFLDLTATWGTSAAGNTLQLVAYVLESLF